MGDASLPELLRLAWRCVVLRDMPQRPLLVVSSDMNHFANVAETHRLDGLALNAIATRDPECVYETVRQNRISMCGMAPCVVARRRCVAGLSEPLRIGRPRHQRRRRRPCRSGCRLRGNVVWVASFERHCRYYGTVKPLIQGI